MNTASVLTLIGQLEDDIDDLEETLEPIIAQALAASTKKLPLLDKAKLYVVIVYAIESLLFSYLRLHGVSAKEHPVYRELTRVKQYFEKINGAEEGPPKTRENLALNKQAAGRIIQHALSGNEKHDLERAEREAREKFLAKRKLFDLEKKMKEKAMEEDTTLVDAAMLQLDTQEPAQDPADDEGSEEGEVDESSIAPNPVQRVVTGNGPEPEAPTIAVVQANGPHRKRKRGGENAELQQLNQGEVKLSKKARKKARKAAAAAEKKKVSG